MNWNFRQLSMPPTKMRTEIRPQTALWKEEYSFSNPELLALPGMQETDVRNASYRHRYPTMSVPVIWCVPVAVCGANESRECSSRNRRDSQVMLRSVGSNEAIAFLFSTSSSSPHINPRSIETLCHACRRGWSRSACRSQTGAVATFAVIADIRRCISKAWSAPC